jgi:hypothetical protein
MARQTPRRFGWADDRDMSVNALIVRIRDYVQHWNTDAKPFT